MGYDANCTSLTRELFRQFFRLVLLILGVEDDSPAVQADLLGVNDVAQQRQRVFAASVP